MSLTTTGGASMPVKTLRTRSTRTPARARVLVVAEPVRVRAAGLGEVERDALDHCGEREDRQGFAQVALGEPHDLGAADLDRRGDGLDPLGHRPAAVEHHQRVTPVEGHAGAVSVIVAVIGAGASPDVERFLDVLHALPDIRHRSRVRSPCRRPDHEP